MYKLLIVDDEEIIRNGLAAAVDWQAAGFEVAATAGNGAEALECLRQCAMDVVLTDIRMPIMDGLELSANIKARYPRIKTILLSAYGEFEYAVKAIESSVFGYLLKSDDEEELEIYFRNIKELLDMEPSAFAHLPAPNGADEKMEECGAGCHNKIISDAIRYMRAHYAQNITLNLVAVFTHVHPVHVSRLFSQKLGKTFLDVLTEIRIEKAKELLEGSALKIYEVAEAVGYKKPSYFAEIFKAKTGMAPADYRNQSAMA
jgi:YesN/AraC family two-component response regulator